MKSETSFSSEKKYPIADAVKFLQDNGYSDKQLAYDFDCTVAYSDGQSIIEYAISQAQTYANQYDVVMWFYCRDGEYFVSNKRPDQIPIIAKAYPDGRIEFMTQKRFKSAEIPLKDSI